MASYIDAHLEPGERVEARAWLSLWSLVPAFIAGSLFLSGAVSVLMRPELLTGRGSLIAAMLLGVAGVFVIVRAVVMFYVTEQAVTNRRVLTKRGAIRRNASTMELRKVEQVRLEQSIAGRLFAYGTVLIEGAGDQGIRISGISEPVVFQGDVDRAKVAFFEELAGHETGTI